MAILQSQVFEQLRANFARLSDRERRLVLLLSACASGLFLLFMTWWTYSALDAREKRVALREEQLIQILALEAKYQDAENEEKAAIRRLKANRVSLFSLLNQSAAKLGMQLNDLNERRQPVRDSEVMQVSVEVNLKNVSIDKLNQFLEDVEGKTADGLVKIVKFKATTRHDAPELLDVTLTVSTWTQS